MEVEITHSLNEQRKVLRRILESQYNDSDSMRLIEVLFINIETQDKKFINKIKCTLSEESAINSEIVSGIFDDIDKLTGFAILGDKE